MGQPAPETRENLRKRKVWRSPRKKKVSRKQLADPIGIIPPLCPHWGSRLARRALLPHVARPVLLMAILAETKIGQITKIQFVPFLVLRCRPCPLQRRTEVAKLLPPTGTKRFAVCTSHSQRKSSESRSTILSQTPKAQKT